MQIYGILVILFLFVEVDVTLSTENSAHCEITRDEDDEYCGAICYPIVKPLLRYAAICQGKDSTISELQDQIREKDVYNAKLESKLQLSMASEVHASQQMEILKVQLNLKEMLKHMKDLRESEAEQKSSDQRLKDMNTELLRKEREMLKQEQEMKDKISNMEKEIQDLRESEAEQKSSDQQLKDMNTELLRKEREMLKQEQEMRDKISNMEKEIQARDVQLQSKDKSIKELKKLKAISDANSCSPFVNSYNNRPMPVRDGFDVRQWQ